MGVEAREVAMKKKKMSSGEWKDLEQEKEGRDTVGGRRRA